MMELSEWKHPWRNKELLKTLHFDKGLTQGEISDRLGCTRRTVSEWFSRHDLEARKGKPRTPGVYFETNRNGYEMWQDECKVSRSKVCTVHRLLAVAEYGFDAVADHHAHHKNGIKWDNRPENIEIVTPTEHKKRHPVTERREDGTAISVGLVTPGDSD